MKILIVLAIGLIFNASEALDQNFSKNLSPNFANSIEPFTPPKMQSHKDDRNPIEPSIGILPQIIPPDINIPLPKSPILAPKTKEFIISYRVYTKNGIAQGEKYDISEPIVSRVNNPKYTLDYTCRIDTLIGDFVGDDDEDYALKYILEERKDKIIDCLSKGGVKIRDDSMTHNFEAKTKTLLTLPPKSVLAYMDNGYLILEVFKERKF